MIDVHDIVALAMKAGKAIMDVYECHDFKVERKGDGTFLTDADRQSHDRIESGLQNLTPAIPMLSEESKSADISNRFDWERFWLVDPLDGTEEFVERSDEFSVNIALIEGQRPVLGVVHAPVTGTTYFATSSEGAFFREADGSISQISVRTWDPEQTIMVASNCHLVDEVLSYKKVLENHTREISIVTMGSSLKICLVAEGKADIYPRMWPTMEWDTAAADCVLEAAGGKLVRLDGTPLIYNKPNQRNPWFLACGDPAMDWCSPARGVVEQS